MKIKPFPTIAMTGAWLVGFLCCLAGCAEITGKAFAASDRDHAECYVAANLANFEAGQSESPRDTKDLKPDRDARAKCECNGTRFVTQKINGKLKRVPCDCRNCNCEPPTGYAAAPDQRGQEAKPNRLLVFLGCPNGQCTAWAVKAKKDIHATLLKLASNDPKIVAKPWDVSDADDSDVQIIDAALRADLVERWKVRSPPLAIRLRDGQATHRISGAGLAEWNHTQWAQFANTGSAGQP